MEQTIPVKEQMALEKEYATWEKEQMTLEKK